MPTHAAFLRGVNLGPRRRVSGADLRSLFERVGLREVATFRTSGNVVFAAEGGSPRQLADRIETGLASPLGFEVTVFLRTAAELRAIAGHEPFDPRLVKASKGKLQVTLLGAKPKPTPRDRVLALATDEDRLALDGRELYWLPSGGTRDSALSMKAIEDALGPGTMRTKGTIEQLAAKFFAP
jgi:uncharacterized protein (DUF1697 family)